MNPKPFLLSNHFTVPVLTLSEKQRIALVNEGIPCWSRAAEVTRNADLKTLNIVEDDNIIESEGTVRLLVAYNGNGIGIALSASLSHAAAVRSADDYSYSFFHFRWMEWRAAYCSRDTERTQDKASAAHLAVDRLTQLRLSVYLPLYIYLRYLSTVSIYPSIYLSIYLSKSEY
jgi:hypothetical protein